MGIALLVISIVIILAYAYIMFATPYSLFLLRLTGVIAIAVIFGILAWVGYALATTPPKPIEEIEKEIEEELKKLEEETKQQAQRQQQK